MNSFLLSMQSALGEVLRQLIEVFPRIFGAVLVLWLGILLAEWIKKVMRSLFARMEFSKAFQKTPVEHFLHSIGLETIENVLSSVVYWLLLLVVVQTTVSMLGLSTLTQMFNAFFGYLPHLLSAFIVLLLGVGLAGFAESFVKRALSSLDVHTSRLAGKVASYIVLVLTGLIAVSELGIARDFILIIFIGFMSIVSLGLGLALGLGGKDLVKTLLDDWYKRMKKTSATSADKE